MRAIQTETQLPIGKIKAILEQEIAELIGGVDMRQLVKDKLFAATRNPITEANEMIRDAAVARAEAEGAQAAADIADERPSERAMRLSRPAFDERMKEVKAEQRDPRAAGRTPPNHSILKGK